MKIETTLDEHAAMLSLEGVLDRGAADELRNAAAALGDHITDLDLARRFGIGAVDRHLVGADGIGGIAAGFEDPHGPQVFVETNIFHNIFLFLQLYIFLLTPHSGNSHRPVSTTVSTPHSGNSTPPCVNDSLYPT